MRLPQQGKAHYDQWCHIRVVVAGERPFAWLYSKTMAETLGLAPASKKPKLRVVKGYSPREVYQAASLQSSFQSLKWGREAGQAIKAADMHAALGADTVIEFDDDEELDTDTSDSATELRARLDATQGDVKRLWGALRGLGLHLEKELPLQTVLARLSLIGEDFDTKQLEATLDLWIGRQPGARMLNIQSLGGLFVKQ